MSKLNPTKTYVFDFESNSCEPAYVYLAGFARLSKLEKKYVKVYYNIEDSVNYIFSRANNSTFYAHNLKYDLSFILAYLFKNYSNEFVITKKIIQPLTKSIFSMTIKFREKTVTFIDSLPIFSAPLADVLKAFTELEKGETPLFDYIEDIKISSYVIDYLKTDVIGLGLALINRKKYGCGKLTTASDALASFKNTVKNYEQLFPKLPSSIDEKMRPAYKGGITYLNPKYKSLFLNDVHVIDVNSMYPSQMYKKPLPYGEPFEVASGEVETCNFFKLGMQRFRISSAFIKDNKMPFLSSNANAMGVSTYYSEIDETFTEEKRTFLVTLPEFELFKESYDHEGLELLGGFLFKARTGLFEDYINENLKLKASDNKTVKTIGKLFLNSLYGKFGESHEKTELNVTYNEKISFQVHEKTKKPVGYLPVAAFVTAYARVFLIETINSFGLNDFIYCDTDSVHFLNDKNLSKIETHPTELGAWDYENYYKKAIYHRAKRYCGQLEDGSLKFACAGIKTKDLKNQVKTLEEFQLGRLIDTIEFKQGSNGQYVRKKQVKI